MSLVLVLTDKVLTAAQIPVLQSAGIMIGLGVVTYAAMLLLCFRPAVDDALSLFSLRAK